MKIIFINFLIIVNKKTEKKTQPIMEIKTRHKDKMILGF